MKKLNLSNLEVEKILNGLSALDKLEIESFKLNYTISRNIEKLSSIHKSFVKTQRTINEKYIEVEENGAPKLVSVPGGFDYVFKSPDERKKYTIECESLEEAQTEIELMEIKLSELKPIKKIKGSIIANLSALITEDVSPDVAQ